MGIEKVRKNLLSGAEERLQVVSEKMKVSNEIDRLYNMGEGFAKKGNYSISYFMYFRCLMNMALLHITEKLGESGGFSEKDALRVVVEKKFFPIEKKDYEEMLSKYNQVIGRKYLEQSDVEHVRNLILSLRPKKT
jgi:hypothetical protein